jgi:hypothetical protein
VQEEGGAGRDRALKQVPARAGDPAESQQHVFRRLKHPTGSLEVSVHAVLFQPARNCFRVKPNAGSDSETGDSSLLRFANNREPRHLQEGSQVIGCHCPIDGPEAIGEGKRFRRDRYGRRRRTQSRVHPFAVGATPFLLHVLLVVHSSRPKPFLSRAKRRLYLSINKHTSALRLTRVSLLALTGLRVHPASGLSDHPLL